VVTVNVDGWLNLPPRRLHEKRPAEHFYCHAIRFDDMYEQLILPLKGQRPIQVEADLTEQTATVYHRHVNDFRKSTLSCSKASTWKHFCSRLGLALHNDISGGRVLRSQRL
jgi:hypothetical protein